MSHAHTCLGACSSRPGTASDPGAVFLGHLADTAPTHFPFTHWQCAKTLPPCLIAALGAVPFDPPPLSADDLATGKRDSHNSHRIFYNAETQRRFDPCARLARAFQNPSLVAKLAAITGAALHGTFLRLEHCLDRDGFWLEPHPDIAAKKLTFLIYLNEPPLGEDWGTDLFHPNDLHWVGSAPCHPGSGLLFVPAQDTWHGFRRKPITGIRRSIIINYVAADWRARHELAFPDAPVSLHL